MMQGKPDIRSTPTAMHGAFDYEELTRLGLTPDAVLDFSVNSNPYGPVPGVHAALANVPLERYPDRECLALRHKLAALHGTAMEHIVVGNGTAELLLLIACAFLERGAVVGIPEIAFSEYERVARLMGAAVRTLPWRPADPEQHVERLGNSLTGTRLVFLGNPNNPDGAALPGEQICSWARQNPHTLFVVDEAYANFLLAPQTLIPSSLPNLLVLRSLTKDYALAGLRLGYAVGSPDCIEAIRLVRPAWNVNAMAQAAGLAVLEQTSWLRQTVSQLHTNKNALYDQLRALHFTPQPSPVHYFLIHVGSGHDFRAQLLRDNMLVRDCASFGLPAYVRIATRTPEDNARLLESIASIRSHSFAETPTRS